MSNDSSTGWRIRHFQCWSEVELMKNIDDKIYFDRFLSVCFCRIKLKETRRYRVDMTKTLKSWSMIIIITTETTHWSLLFVSFIHVRHLENWAEILICFLFHKSINSSLQVFSTLMCRSFRWLIDDIHRWINKTNRFFFLLSLQFHFFKVNLSDRIDFNEKMSGKVSLGNEFCLVFQVNQWVKTEQLKKCSCSLLISLLVEKKSLLSDVEFFFQAFSIVF